MKKQILKSILFTALISMILFFFLIVALIYHNTNQDFWGYLSQETKVFTAGYEVKGVDFFSDAPSSCRITLIDPTGKVLFDNRESPASMENHLHREEVAQALSLGIGRNERSSATLGKRTLYYAIKQKDDSVLRLSLSQDALWDEMGELILPFVISFVVVVLLALWIAQRKTKKIIAPLNQISLDDQFFAQQSDENFPVYDEFIPFIHRVQEQNHEIRRQMETIKQKQEEFFTITQNMSEGLIVTDQAMQVLTINKSALSILTNQTQSPTLPSPLLVISRNLLLETALKQGLEGKRVEEILSLRGREYRLLISPTTYAGKVQGTVALLMDDTENLQAEKIRQEFSANVSHELKTPLTSISGYAEIIRDGLVKPEDVADFAGKIHCEAARLIDLIQDIIQLSKLDEKEGYPAFSSMDVRSIAEKVIEQLSPVAEKKQVTLTLQGPSLPFWGQESLMKEMIFNLVENAIRYNLPGGEVVLTLRREENEICVDVKDTGIGIDPAEQDRIFERFYTVDKSHSRQEGATGLGLSIVKRGALYHQGQARVSSSLGKGSVFTLCLPIENPYRE
ncbi:MAG: hypothetical protein GX786_01375 [Clostridiales bacterium]|nr:hypothetical protein [Clostridiales bacterium]